MEHVKRGKLRLKGGSKLKPSSTHKHKKHKKKPSKRRAEEEEAERQESAHDEEKHAADSDVELDDMTPAQRRHAEHQKKREAEEIEKVAGKTYRERIEELNQYLGNLTEHHDVPRVSAAGNG